LTEAKWRRGLEFLLMKSPASITVTGVRKFGFFSGLLSLVSGAPKCLIHLGKQCIISCSKRRERKGPLTRTRDFEIYNLVPSNPDKPSKPAMPEKEKI
jgi:hypothetical protein